MGCPAGSVGAPFHLLGDDIPTWPVSRVGSFAPCRGGFGFEPRVPRDMKKPRRFFWFAALVLAAGAGFLAGDFLDRPPSFDLSEIEFPRALRQSGNMPVVEVLFVTNRRPAEGGKGGVFGDEPDGTLHYGRA